MRKDLIREAAQKGQFVVWEESARDGAQAKTLISGKSRVEMANMMGAMFNGSGPHHVIFCAGFPAIHKAEFNATRQVASEVVDVSLTCLCRSVPKDITMAFDAMRGAVHGRVFMFVPMSEPTAQALMHKTAPMAMCRGLEALDFAMQISDNIPVDIALVDIANADIGLLIEATNRAHDSGAATVMLADTTGEMFPHEVYNLFSEIKRNTHPDVVFVSHMHNDLGFGLINVLEAARAGTFIGASSFLGLGERAGMAHTEEIIFHIAHHANKLRNWGIQGELWTIPPNLTYLPRIANFVSQNVDIPILINKPIVGLGVNTISTETPFKDRDAFRPFDPAIMGLKPEIVLTHLAHTQVVQAIAKELKIDIPIEKLDTVIQWIKAFAYQQDSAEIPREYFCAYLDGLLTPQRQRT